MLSQPSDDGPKPIPGNETSFYEAKQKMDNCFGEFDAIYLTFSRMRSIGYSSLIAFSEECFKPCGMNLDCRKQCAALDAQNVRSYYDVINGKYEAIDNKIRISFM